MNDAVPRPGSTAGLEQLALALSRRDLRSTLAPDSSSEPALEVISPRLGSIGAPIRAGRAYWHNGAYWRSRRAEPEQLPDTARAAGPITAALRWSRRCPALARPAQAPAASEPPASR